MVVNLGKGGREVILKSLNIIMISSWMAPLIITLIMSWDLINNKLTSASNKKNMQIKILKSIKRI